MRSTLQPPQQCTAKINVHMAPCKVLDFTNKVLLEDVVQIGAVREVTHVTGASGRFVTSTVKPN